MNKAVRECRCDIISKRREGGMNETTKTTNIYRCEESVPHCPIAFNSALFSLHVYLAIVKYFSFVHNTNNIMIETRDKRKCHFLCRHRHHHFFCSPLHDFYLVFASVVVRKKNKRKSNNNKKQPIMLWKLKQQHTECTDLVFRTASPKEGGSPYFCIFFCLPMTDRSEKQNTQKNRHR